MADRMTCQACGAASPRMHWRNHKFLCPACAGPATCDDTQGAGPVLCWRCREPVNPRSGELMCEPCLWAEKSAS